MKTDVLNIKGEVVNTVELKDDIFAIEPNEPVVHQVVVAYLANPCNDKNSVSFEGGLVQYHDISTPWSRGLDHPFRVCRLFG